MAAPRRAGKIASTIMDLMRSHMIPVRLYENLALPKMAVPRTAGRKGCQDPCKLGTTGLEDMDHRSIHLSIQDLTSTSKKNGQ